MWVAHTPECVVYKTNEKARQFYATKTIDRSCEWKRYVAHYLRRWARKRAVRQTDRQNTTTNEQKHIKRSKLVKNKKNGQPQLVIIGGVRAQEHTQTAHAYTHIVRSTFSARSFADGPVIFFFVSIFRVIIV